MGMKQLEASYSRETITNQIFYIVSLGQFFLEGRVDADLKEKAIQLLKQEMAPEKEESWGKEAQAWRVQRFTRYVEVLEAAPTR